MKKNIIIIFLMLMFLTLIFPLTINSAQINPEKYKSSGPSAQDVKEMYSFGGRVAGVVQVVGTIVSVGVLIIIGIRYVMSSADEKAELRERLIPYFIGAVLLFGASNIVNIAYKMFK